MYPSSTQEKHFKSWQKLSLLKSIWPHWLAALARLNSGMSPINESEATMEKTLIKKLYETWSQDDLSAIDSLIAESYTIFSDPGDAWESQTLDRLGYRNRLLHSRKAFPDLVFEITQSLHENDRVAVIWKALGTHLGDLPGLPATGKKLSFSGQTVYAIKDGKVTGHWQTIDRLGFIQQLRQ